MRKVGMMRIDQNISRRSLLALAGGLFLGTFCGAPLLAAEPLGYVYLCSRLYPKTEAEDAYLQEVANGVENGTLPEKLVRMALKYAEKKSQNKRIRYFGESLTYFCVKNNIKEIPKTPW